MSYTEVSSESWFSRIGGSIKGIIAGIVLIPLSIVVLFWNEGRAVERKKALDEGSKNVISLTGSKLTAENEGKLIHTSGPVTTDENLEDEIFNISISDALKLQRQVEYYQYVEESDSNTKKKLGGGTETTTNYTYTPKWVKEPIDSSAFKETHYRGKNIILKNVPKKEMVVKTATLGDFKLSTAQLAKMKTDTLFTPKKPEPEPESPDTTKKVDKIQIAGNYFYFGKMQESPSIGDVRVSFKYAPIGDYSVIAQQKGNSFVKYQTKTGSLDMIKSGIHTSEAMFTEAKSNNKKLSWVFRIGGALVMTIGFGMILRPLSVLGDVVPFIGSIIGKGTGMVAILLSTILSSITIAGAWLFYRPLISISLLAVAGIALFLILKKRKKVTEQ